MEILILLYMHMIMQKNIAVQPIRIYIAIFTQLPIDSL